MINLHYWPTPNGKKVTILLEELNTPYNIIPCRISQGDQFKSEFLAMNPNHRMPVIEDDAPLDGKEPIIIFESGAIMTYLAEKEGRFLPNELRERTIVNQWVNWQMANQGPKLGECGHFLRLGDDQGDQSYAIRRFTNETNRLYGVLNNRLHKSRYLAGEHYTIADMICYPWCVNWKFQRQDLSEFKYVEKWFNELSDRPQVQAGMAAGSDLSTDQSSLNDSERTRIREIMYNQRALPIAE
ncbi:MAG: glutathione S-transferase [Rhodospirillaceae bacterium]|nr:glutathione S-transferase [Rhodospirillaceae bacterium]|tara:strand:+ start:878 stop:1600 length:723 start_codon:yes stop_codon:yes gene_type:complete